MADSVRTELIENPADVFTCGQIVPVPPPNIFDQGKEMGLTTELLPIIPTSATISPKSGLSPSNVGKSPGVPNKSGQWTGFIGWSDHQTSEQDLLKWASWGVVSVGINCRKHPCIDNDIDDPVLSAQVSNIITQSHPTAVRTRDNSPRRSFFFTLAPGEISRAKRRIILKDDLGQVEFLGFGSQSVLYGPHQSGAMQTLTGTMAVITAAQLDTLIEMLLVALGGDKVLKTEGMDSQTYTGKRRGGEVVYVANAQDVKDAHQHVGNEPGADKGERDKTCYKLAAHIREYFGVNADDNEEAMQNWALKCDPEFPPREVKAKVQSVYSLGGAQKAQGEGHPTYQLQQAGFGKQTILPAGCSPVPLEGVVLPAILAIKPVFNLIPISELTLKPISNHWQIKGVFEKNSLGLIFGPPASAKSFIAMDMAFCVATGINWNGNQTEQGKVAYLAGEGFNGMSRRFKALELKYNIKTDNLFLSELPASLIEFSNTVTVSQAIQSICPDASLIIIDTLHRNFGGGDENSSKDLGAFINNIDIHLRKTGATVLIVHHSGHGDQDRSRGSSSIKAAMDVEYKISKVDDDVTMECTKSKEFEKPEPLSFKLKSQPLGWTDEDGKPITSAILNPSFYIKEKNGVKLSSNDNLILKVLSELIESKGMPVSENAIQKLNLYEGKKCITLEVWRDEVYPLLDVDSDKKQEALKKAFQRSRKKLKDAGRINMFDDHFWLDL